MERGYFKVWRKIEDSQSYNRSSIHRALLLTIFVKANWKGGFFCGRDIAPGQIATSIKSLAEELREPRTNITRALRDIEKDGVIKIENVANRWSLITLVNWQSYQAKEEKSGQPVDNHRITTGRPADTIKEGKKEEIPEGGQNARASEAPVVLENPDGPSTTRGVPKRTDCPSKGNPQWPAFYSCWQVYPVKQGQEAAWCEWMRLHGNGTLAESYAIRDAILLLAQEDSRWQRGKVPNMAKWLSGKGWNDCPYAEPVAAQGIAPRDGPPTARTQAQRNRQNLEGIAAFVRAADREIENGNTTAHIGGIGAHGHCLQASN